MTTATRASSYYRTGEHPQPEFELQRLREQALMFWPKELRNFQQLGLRPDWDVLDAGAGPGFITEQLLNTVPQGTVTALELDEGLLGEARSHLAAHEGGRLRLLQGSITQAPLPDAQFDLALARLVLQHLADPAQALAELNRLVRPGGRLVVADADDAMWGSVHPAIPGLDAVLAKRRQHQAKRGGNRYVGRAMPAMMRAAGFEQITVESVAISSDELGMDALAGHLDVQARMSLLVKEGAIAEEQISRVQAEAEEFLATPDASFVLLMFLYSGVKQDGGQR
ncbi:methyltransferase domain-containing protein [Streptomyces sp. SID8375]|uniref:methyltransferase domain-containing protein n=1 Tax=unclassified Streptomyces TaxID=2593676 RepID=UPI00036E9F59|nr:MULTISPECIES: methyltransferase domain-containing protein [unclassified Streptomyces]MYX09103.1 methyltransferase domain-containing protein [Streptomyces sp. SID8375]